MFGYVHNLKPLNEIIEDSIEVIAESSPKRRVILACANPHSLVVAKDSPLFADALKNATHLVTDGVGLYLAGKLTKDPVGPRVTGSDYYYGLLKKLNEDGSTRLGRRAKVFFLGSSDKVLKLIEARFKLDYPHIEFSGAYSPPFRDFSEADNKEMVAIVNAAKPDVLWVGMTAPKQETWVESIRERVETPVIGSVGAVFDFYAGTYPRAPEWAIKLGLEWIVRLVREPKRMWRRNFVSTPKFISIVIISKITSLIKGS